MAPPKIRADYDALKDVAARFRGQAQAAQQTLQKLSSQLDVLQGGDWVGQGATAFYQEMGGQVMPTMKRLAGALETAAQSTLQISQAMQQAEAEAARVLRGPGGGSGGPGDAGGTSLPGGGGSGGAGSGGVPGPGGGMGDVKLAEERDRAEAVKQAAAAQLKAENESVDRALTKLDPKVRELVKQSPTLRAEVLKLEQAGYTFKTGPVADGYYTDWTNKVITIDQPLGDLTTVSHVAHEVGHGVSNQQQSIPATPTMTRDQYVKANVDNLMHNEGEAQFNAAKVRAELNAAGKGDTGIPGTQSAAYQKAYDDFAAGKITQAQAIDQMGTLMGNEHVSVPPYKAYRDYYGDSFKTDFDTNIAPKRKP